MKKIVITLVVSILAMVALFIVGQGWLRTLMFNQHLFMAPHHPHHRGHGFIQYEPNASFYFGNHLMNVIQWLLPLLLVIVGIIIWKSARRGRLKKWMGMALVGVGLVIILPKLILILLIIIGAYVAFKSKNSKDTLRFSDSTDGQAFNSNTDFLDQWEKKIKTEE